VTEEPMVPTTFRLPRQLRQEFIAAAKANGESASEIVRRAAAAYVKKSK